MSQHKDVEAQIDITNQILIPKEVKQAPKDNNDMKSFF